MLAPPILLCAIELLSAAGAAVFCELHYMRGLLKPTKQILCVAQCTLQILHLCYLKLNEPHYFKCGCIQALPDSGGGGEQSCASAAIHPRIVQHSSLGTYTTTRVSFYYSCFRSKFFRSGTDPGTARSELRIGTDLESRNNLCISNLINKYKN